MMEFTEVEGMHQVVCPTCRAAGPRERTKEKAFKAYEMILLRGMARIPILGKVS